MLHFSEFIQYFTHLADIHPLIDFSIWGDSEKILESDRDFIKYPCLWIESPEIRPVQTSDDLAWNYSGSVVILSRYKPDSFLDEQFHLDKTHRIAMDLVAKMIQDDDILNINPSSWSLYAVNGYNTNTEVGWRLEFQVRFSDSVCVPDAMDEVLFSQARFSWINQADGSFDVTVTPEHLNDSGLSASWSYSIDGATPITSPTPPTVLSPGNQLYIQVALSGGPSVKYASALIGKNQDSGHSVPFIIPK